jgi:hypothetical protein
MMAAGRVVVQILMSALGLSLAVAALSADQPLESHLGVVREVQLIDVSALGESAILILSLEDGTSYLIPGERQIPASAGVEVAVDYLLPAQDDVPREACTIRVLGLPIVLEGEEVLHRAQRPFEIYRNDNPDCMPENGQTD